MKQERNLQLNLMYNIKTHPVGISKNLKSQLIMSKIISIRLFLKIRWKNNECNIETNVRPDTEKKKFWKYVFPSDELKMMNCQNSQKVYQYKIKCVLCQMRDEMDALVLSLRYWSYMPEEIIFDLVFEIFVTLSKKKRLTD